MHTTYGLLLIACFIGSAAPYSWAEDRPVPGAEDRPVPGAEDRPVPGAEDRHAPGTEDAERVQIEKAMCAKGDCRRNVHVRLKLEEGKSFERRFPILQPILQQSTISILPGETLNIEAEIKDGKCTNMRAVTQAADPKKAIVFRFEQTAMVGDGSHMLLTVKHPFDQTLKFRMSMMGLDGEVSETSSCPVQPGVEVYEHWPHPIFQLIIDGCRTVSGDAITKCEI